MKMNLDRRKFDGWALEIVDFDRLPSDAGYIFRNAGVWYVCYPTSGQPTDRQTLLRVIDWLRRAGPDVRLGLEAVPEHSGVSNDEALGGLRLEEETDIAISQVCH
ncbi:hypothetical protein [Burkholderia sp. MSMB1826]|uniref:hypothetical protein n=1 Tax=Burkholderia sp. MSMB1826 TaxID=1637875 RepID=UPI000752CB0A|nr:hypothetical protein [Burkholderia sp. MSMB1826]KVL14666.1 hypothetical protein WS95_22525 [Burkholderia sp. MSMB1826]